MLVIKAPLVIDDHVILPGLDLIDLNRVCEYVHHDTGLLVEYQHVILSSLIVGQIHDQQLHVAQGALKGLQSLLLIFTTLFDHLARQHDHGLLWRLHLLRNALTRSHEVVLHLFASVFVYELGQILHVEQVTRLIIEEHFKYANTDCLKTFFFAAVRILILHPERKLSTLAGSAVFKIK